MHLINIRKSIDLSLVPSFFVIETALKEYLLHIVLVVVSEGLLRYPHAYDSVL
jgi:hypothetical protein